MKQDNQNGWQSSYPAVPQKTASIISTKSKWWPFSAILPYHWEWPQEVLTQLPTEQQTEKRKFQWLDLGKNERVTYSLEWTGKVTFHQFWSCWREAFCVIAAHSFFYISWSLHQRIKSSSFTSTALHLSTAMTLWPTSFPHISNLGGLQSEAHIPQGMGGQSPWVLEEILDLLFILIFMLKI